MPQFSSGEAKVAIAPIVAKPSGMDCEAELFLGPDALTKVTTSDRIPFVSTGAAKNVSLPINMPSAQGTYHGYIDVFAGSLRFLAYILKEDVTVAKPRFSFGTPTVDFDKELTYTIARMIVLVTNNSQSVLSGKIYACWDWSAPNTCRRRYWDGGVDYYQLSLNPGQSQSVTSPFRWYREGKWFANGPYVSEPTGAYLWFSDEFGGSSPVIGPIVKRL